MTLIYHAVRRGLEYSTARYSTANTHFKGPAQDGPKVEVPAWGSALVIATFIFFVIFISAIDYTLRNVVATLAMVETPSAAITVSASEESAPKDVKEGSLETGPTITLVRQKPITSSIRGTIRHLVSQAGRFSRWRGFKSLFLYNFLFGIVSNIFDKFIPGLPGRLVLVSGLTGALLANIHAAWLHKVISMPHQKSYWSRIPARSSWKSLAFPAALEASAKYLSVYIGQGFVILLGLSNVPNKEPTLYSGKEVTSVMFRGVAVFVVMLVCVLFIVLPALVTLIRVEASILPEDQDTIVPFDRTFAGKVVPQILGGTGCIGFLDAWRSFNWEARRRVIKIYAKMFLINTVLFIVFAHVMILELWAIVGKDLGKFLASQRRH